ncbi:MAG: glycosyltransferase family 2 protein [Streptosporangiaceae bacterium]
MSSTGQPGAPRVTVVTPAYNVARYIGEAVDSVLAQTFSDFEYLIVDDGSTDDTMAVVAARAGDSRMRVVAGQHRGLSAARNVGIREARGRYIAYLDGDDRWNRRFLEYQAGLIESLPPQVGGVFCRSRMILENGTPVFVQWQRPGRYDFDDLLAAGNPMRNGSSLLIRRSCFADAGGFDESLSHVEDLEMWLRIAAESKTPVWWATSRVLTDLRLRPGSLTRDRGKSEAALDALLAAQVPRMRRLPGGLAYVRPAVAAYKYGGDPELAGRWADAARTAGLGRLARSASGLRLLLWSSLPPDGRAALRAAQRRGREAVKAAEQRLRPPAAQAAPPGGPADDAQPCPPPRRNRARASSARPDR